MQTLLQTKFYKPHVPANYVPRQRLIDLLDIGCQRKLILVSAPAGSGKTTLLSAWAHRRDIPCAWFTLDGYDNVSLRFMYYVVNCMQAIGLQIDYRADDRLTLEQDNYDDLMISVINQISRMSQRFVLILDDYHLIQKLDIHRIVDYFLDYLPENMSLVISGRADPPLKLSQLRARGHLLEIRAGDLRFSECEAGSFLNTNTGLGLDPSDISTITAKTEGWITGLQLAALSLKRHTNHHAFVTEFAGNDRYIADYLVDEALNQQPSHIFTFLMQTSLLDQLSDSLCDAVTGLNDSHDILIELERANLFLIPLDTKRQWYRYHQLFADLLRVRLNHMYKDSVPYLYKKAIHWYEKEGLISEAVKCALQAHEIEQVEHLLEGHIITVINSSEISVLRELISHLPAQDRETNPWLALGHAWILAISGGIDLVPSILDAVEGLIRDYPQNKHLKLAGRVLALRSYIAGTKNNRAEAVQLALTALGLLPDDDLSMRGFVSLLLGNAYLYLGDLEEAIRVHVDAHSTSVSAGDTYLTTMILSRLGDIYRMMAQLDKAENTILPALSIINGKKLHVDFPVFITGYVKLRLSGIYYLRNDLHKALDLIEECLDVVVRWGSFDNISLAYVNQVKIHIALGDTVTAMELLRDFKTKYPLKNRYQYHIVNSFEAKVNILTGNELQAAAWAERYGMNTDSEILFHEIPQYLILVQLYIVQNDFSSASIMLDKLWILSSKSGATLYEIEIYLLLAMTYHRMQDEKQAKQYVIKALELAESDGCDRLFLDYSDDIGQILYSICMDGLHVKLCNQIIAQIPTNDKASHTKSSDLLEPLTRREIEVLQHLSTGLSNQEIASELHLSLYTVKSHARNIYSKLGVANRTEAAAKARLVGIILVIFPRKSLLNHPFERSFTLLYPYTIDNIHNTRIAMLKGDFQ